MISRIEFLKKVDVLLGRLVVTCLPASSKGGRFDKPRNLLLIRPGGIGDAVLLVPALTTLRERFPAAGITVLAERRNAAVFDLCPAVDRVLRYDRPREFGAALRGGYDAVIDTEQWHRLSAVAARLTGATVRIGFGTNERARLLTHPLPYSHDDYEALSFFRLLGPLRITPPAEVTVPFLAAPQEAGRAAVELLRPLGGERYVAIFPGASIPERRWGAERFAELARRLAGEGRRVVVVGGREDAGDGERIAGDTGLNLAGRTSLAVTAAVIAGADLLVSGDSGILHVGVGVGTPTVSLFGPGRQKKWGPQGAGHAVINHHLPCSPCTTFGTTAPCPDQARCLSGISVDEVLQAVREMLGVTGNPPLPRPLREGRGEKILYPR